MATKLRTQLCEGAPEWRDFEIVMMGIYLGVPLGRALEVHHVAFAGRRVGAHEKADSRGVIAVPTANAPALLYIAGVHRAPREVARLELDVLGRTLRLPSSAMPIRGQWGLRAWGLAEFPDVRGGACCACARDVAAAAEVVHTLRAGHGGVEAHEPLDAEVGKARARRACRSPSRGGTSWPSQPRRGQRRPQSHERCRRRRRRPAGDCCAPLSRRWRCGGLARRCRRLARPLLGDASEPDQPPDDVTLVALRDHACAVTPQWTVTPMRVPIDRWCASHRMHDAIRDKCLL